MAKTARLRVLIDTENDENVFRDIEIPLSFTFEQFHYTIQNSFGFDASEMASFYISGNDWERGDEIMLMDMGTSTDGTARLMSETKLEEVFIDKNQKLLYIFDFLLMWTFFIEVVDFDEFDPQKEYPVELLTIGESPDQYAKTPEQLFGAMKADTLPGMEDDEEGDDDELYDY